MSPPGKNSFDPQAKETQLREEAQSWNTTVIEDARTGDIPVIDLTAWWKNPHSDEAAAIAERLRDACTTSGFFSITGHDFPGNCLEDAFHQTRRFFALRDDIKDSLRINQPGCKVKGVGYLPYSNNMLPARETSNLNEALIIKRHAGLGLEMNLWPPEASLPGFRAAVTHYLDNMEGLAQKLLPVFAVALELEADFFDEAFDSPLVRMRLARYRPVSGAKGEQFGIAPHVDSSFFTILAQDTPGLVVFNEQRGCWVRVPVIENAFVVNSGEFLKQWSNDHFLSVKHFVIHSRTEEDRFSVPFFFNARPDYVMECLPGCQGPDKPPRYPPISYFQSQAVVQGE